MAENGIAKGRNVRIGSASEMGKSREKNQDFLVADAARGLAVVSDGIGGHRAGEVASRTAAEAIFESITRVARTRGIGPAASLEEAFRKANRTIQHEAERNTAFRGMGSTAVVAWLAPGTGGVWIAHVGDSRAYLFCDRRLSLVTEDHTVQNQMRLAGVLPKDPAAWPSRRILSQALGLGGQIAVQIQHRPFAGGDRILLCTDGLTEAVGDDEIAALMASPDDPQTVSEALVAAGNDHGRKDDITVVLIEAV